MSETARQSCPECGRPLTGGLVDGMCSCCLLARTLSLADSGGDERKVFSVPSAEEARAHFHDFEIREVLGHGGMGVVFLAWQKSLDRPVALKLLPIELLADEEFAERFQHEARVMARLEHPRIAQVFDAGITESGFPYYIMERIEGARITAYCARRGLSVSERLRLFLQICSGVQHAHQKGILHRDLKPSNILVTEHDGQPVAKVIDFGLAQAIESLTGESDSDGRIIGTPAYMSPEQLEAGVEADTRSDIYSLGALLYELLSGKPPFETEEGKSLTRAEVRQRLRHREPLRPSEQLAAREKSAIGNRKSKIDQSLLTSAATELKGDLDAIVMKALARDRGRRYASVGEFSADVQRFFDGLPVTAVPSTATYRFRKFVRRNRALFATLTAILVTLTAGLGVSIWQAIRATRAEEVARRQNYYAQLRAAMRDLKLQEGRSGRFHELLAQPEFLAASESNRGWEWFLLQGLADRSRFVSTPHPGGVDAMAVSGDGRHVASAGQDGFVQVWDLHTNTLPVRFRPRARVLAIAWSPNSRLLALGDVAGQLTLWDAAEKSLTAQWGGHNGAVNSLDWSNDGQRFASGGEDAAVIVWEAATQRTELARFQHPTPVVDLTWAPDNDRIAVAGGPASPVIHVWSVRSNAFVRAIQSRHDPTVAAISLDWNPDGRRLAIGSTHWYLKIHDVETDEDLFIRRLHKGPVRSVRWNSNGERLVTASDDGTLRFYNFDLGLTGNVMCGHRGPVRSVGWAGDGWLASASEDGTIRLWPAFDWVGALRHSRVSAWLSSLAFDPGGRLLAMAGEDRDMEVWDVRTGVRLHRLTGNLASLRDVAWSPDGRFIAAGDADGIIHLWNARTGSIQTNFVGLRELTTLQWHPNGRFWLCLEKNATEAVVLNAESGTRAFVLGTPGTGERPFVTAVACNPDGTRIATGDDEGTIRIFNGNDGRLVSSFSRARSGSPLPSTGRGSKGAVELSAAKPKERDPRNRNLTLNLSGPSESKITITNYPAGLNPGGVGIEDEGRGRSNSRPFAPNAIRALSWRPDSRVIAIGGEDGALSVRDLKGGRTLWSRQAHRGSVTRVAWHPRDERIATAGSDGPVRLFDARTSEEVVVVTEHYNVVTGLAWNADGTRLATGSHDYDVWVFDAAYGNRRRTDPPDDQWWKARDFETPLFLREFWFASGARFNESVWAPRAMELVEQQLKSDPDALFLQAQHAWLLLKMGRLAEAENQARSILATAAMPSGAEMAGRLARATLVQSLRLRDRRGDVARVLGIPGRDPNVAATLIDLTDFYNASLDEAWFDYTQLASRTLASLPRGTHILAGITFDLRGIVQLGGSELDHRGGILFPRRVEGIRVSQTARRLHFLHAGAWPGKATAEQIGSYVIHYADGEQIEIPLRRGQDLDDWQRPELRLNEALSAAKIAWIGRSAVAGKDRTAPVLYLKSWENPRPAVPISHFDFITAEPRLDAAPFLIAITAEP